MGKQNDEISISHKTSIEVVELSFDLNDHLEHKNDSMFDRVMKKMKKRQELMEVSSG